MGSVKANAWSPVEIGALEPAADAAVRDLSSGVVIAGPGAGKTELLAQRACFLFQTDLCAAPKRILAVSFKRDAASNLRRRVRRRCGREAARRFDSLTYDSFAKGLLDRFLEGLPDSLRPDADYEIDLQLDRRASVRKVLGQVGADFRDRAEPIIRSGAEELFFRLHVVGKPIRFDIDLSANQLLGREFWRLVLFTKPVSRLTFSMISRLAELLLRTNPKVLAALRATYGFVFLDEFQDTTQIQYDLTTTAFKGSNASMTAVGDPKQRIMLWAGALEGVFKEFETDFTAKHHGLAMNYRSAPELVRIQQHLISALEPDAVTPEAHRKAEDGEGECRVFVYPNHKTEAKHLAKHLSGLIADGVKPPEICILTRGWNESYSSAVIEELAKLGIEARSEKELQDLLADPVVTAILCVLRLAISKRSALAWAQLTETCSDLWGIDDTVKAHIVERKLVKMLQVLKKVVALTDHSEKALLSLLEQIVELLGKVAIKQQYPQYRRGSYLTEVLEQVASQINSRLSRPLSWQDALDDLEGANAIPIMTVHKSKGLEYDTVVFVGLEDAALWNFHKFPNEEKCGFFVAFSRAIKRVVFTFSEFRPRSSGAAPEKQHRKTIGSLYTLLEEAGIHTEVIGKLDS